MGEREQERVKAGESEHERERERSGDRAGELMSKNGRERG